MGNERQMSLKGRKRPAGSNTGSVESRVEEVGHDRETTTTTTTMGVGMGIGMSATTSSTSSLESLDNETYATEDTPTKQQDQASIQQQNQDALLNKTKFKARDCITYIGPGFLMAIAYIDPGNFESDMQAGAQFNMSLLWVLTLSTVAGLLVQVLCVRLAMTTGMHLARLCRNEYSPMQGKMLWLLTEIAIVASDIPEVIGTAFALKMLFQIPVAVGIIVTSASAMLFLLLQQFGARILEAFFAILVAIISMCFVAELSYVGSAISVREVFAGLFSFGYLQQPIKESAYIAVSMIGALIMPHNLFLHSALVLVRDKKGNNNDAEDIEGVQLLSSIKKLRSGLPLGVQPTKLIVFYNALESALALLFSLFINAAVVIVASATAAQLTGSEKQELIDNPLQNGPSMLKNVLGSNAKISFGLALLASGFTSTMTGTLAGQYVMEGFLNFKINPAARAFITRATAIVPSLLVTLIAGESGSESLIILSSVVLSFELPFALIPLVKFVCSEQIMGSMVVTGMQKLFIYFISLIVVVANVFMLGSSVITSTNDARSEKSAALISMAAIMGFIYVGSIYFMLSKEVKQKLKDLNPTRWNEISASSNNNNMDGQRI